MSAIGPGDWVECVDAALRNDSTTLPPRPLVVGALYQVHDICFCAEWPNFDDDALELIEYPERDEHGWRLAFSADRFRPIYRPRADLIESLLTPLPENVLEQA